MDIRAGCIGQFEAVGKVACMLIALIVTVGVDHLNGVDLPGEEVDVVDLLPKGGAWTMAPPSARTRSKYSVTSHLKRSGWLWSHAFALAESGNRCAGGSASAEGMGAGPTSRSFRLCLLLRLQ